MHSDTYFDVLTHAKRVKTRVGDAAEGVSKRILHLANLPAGTDIRRVREQLARMERRLIDVSKDVDDFHRERQLDQESNGPQATPDDGSA